MAKHHFVPQFYLKAFIEPESGGSRNPYLWVVDLQSRTLRRRAPKNVAYITGFYDWDKHGDRAPSIEAIYSQIEGKAASVIGALRAHDFGLSLEDRFDLSNFLGFQLTRTPRFRQAAVDALTKHAQEWLQEHVQDTELLEARLRDYSRGKQDSTLTVESIRDFVENKRHTLTPGTDYVMGRTMEAGLEFARIVFEMNWSVLLAAEGSSFFTSDQPVALLTPDARPRKLDRRTGRIPELEMSFAVSPACSLLLHQEKVQEHIVSLDGEQVAEINRRTFPVVNRYVFCSSEQLGKWALGQ